MKKTISLLWFFSVFAACAQEAGTLQSLVEAEKAFAATSAARNTRDAFLAYLSDSGIIFRPGPVNGKQAWEKTPVNEHLLSWEPVVAGISATGDLGYTTGPWEFRNLRTDTNAVATGYFVSIWKKEHAGWRVALDIGISFPNPGAKEQLQLTDRPKTNEVSTDQQASIRDLLASENSFIQRTAKEGVKSYADFLDAHARIYRGGKPPVINVAQWQDTLPTGKTLPVFVITSAVVSGDLGYVYGRTTANSKVEFKTTVSGNYLRIWRRMQDGKFKIVLDLLDTEE
ncbi:MAG TPA: nuclear transport factor 2 family protein [Chitinophagaceae bacterium]|nr:nuclear transport factor 2 family protein [Chitinophagaceae bacterium]